MNDLISLEKIAQWQKLKTLVLDSVSSPITKRVYSMALDEFMGWFQQAPRAGFTKATVSAWRVFKRSRVAGAHPHRFRHTLASELLAKDGSIEKVAGILGDSPATIRRYYAKWTPEFQTLQDDLIRKIHGTHLAQPQKEARTC